MRLTARTLVFVLAVAIALPIIIDAQSTPTTARSEARIQLGDLLFGDQRFWEAIRVYDQAKEGTTQEQLELLFSEYGEILSAALSAVKDRVRSREIRTRPLAKRGKK